jgi:uncharacterized protein (TIGR01319 family)
MSATTSAVLVDFGSTFTKVRVVGSTGRIIASAQHRTTVDGDVLDGLKVALAEIDLSETDFGRVLACSSAGGGLRMAVVGLIEDLTAAAAKQAALGAGARVLGVVSGGLAGPDSARELLAEDPDIVLLVGGTDGGDSESLTGAARALAAVAPEVPVVLAGNVEAQGQAEATLSAAGVQVFRAANVMPAVGELTPEPARALVRDLFISHVIAGKLGGSKSTLKRLVRMATPDAALHGVEVLAEVLAADGMPGGIVVVDVGGATTDVHSSVPNDEPPGYKRPLLPQPLAARTVEADLGMRWNAPGIVEAAVEERLIDADRAADLAVAAERRAADPSFLPEGEVERELDRALARIAIAIALRRHAGVRRLTLQSEGTVLTHEGRDLSETAVLIGTGGVLQNMEGAELEASLELAGRGREERLLPRRARAGVDRRGILATAGLLDQVDPAAARSLLAAELEAILAAGKSEMEEEDVRVAP